MRTDHPHLQALQPSSAAAQELKLLTEDYQRQIRQQTRLVNQLTNTLKAYYPRALEIAELTTALAQEFLRSYPTPESVSALTERKWQRWARAHRLSDARTRELWGVLQQPQLPVPAHVVRAKARLTRSLVEQLTLVVAAVAEYRKAIEDFSGASRRRSGHAPCRSVSTASRRRRCGPASATHRGDGSRFAICRRRPAPSRSRSEAASSSGSCSSATPVTRRCGTWSITWHSCRCSRVSGLARTTTSSESGDTLTARPCGRWAPNG
jgi:hypothetical protein